MLDGDKIPDSTAFRPAPTASRCKVGLDIGTTTTVCRQVFLPAETPIRPWGFSFPTPLTRSSPDRETGPFRRGIALLDLANALKAKFSLNGPGRPWGVIGCPSGAEPCQIQERRDVAGILFDRFLLIEEPLLVAMGILHVPMGRHVVVVDIGTGSTRASLVGGTAPTPQHLSIIPQGGNSVDEVLKRLLLQKYPSLLLSDRMIQDIKEKLGFVPPVERRAELKLVLGRHKKMVDISEIMSTACETVVPPVLKAIQGVLSRCPSDHIEEFLASILLVGGGAAIRGLPRRIQDELAREGMDSARVHFVQDPRSLIALGALKCALQAPDSAWKISLFSNCQAAESA